MRKSYMAVLLLSLVLIGVACADSTKTETPTGSAEAAPTERRAGEAQVEGDPVRFVMVNDLRLRKGSGAEAEVIGELQGGDRVTLTGPQSEENYTAELRGRKVTAPWVEVETPLGKRAWVFGGALGDAPAPLGDSSAKVEAYRAYLDGLPPDNCASLNPAAEKLKQDFKGAAGAVRDAAIRAFWGYYHDAIREAAKLVYRADMEAEFETYNWESQRFSSKVAQRKADEWKICGIGMEFPEGMVTLMEAADYMYDHFYAFGSRPMQEYLKQH
ncbi:MAG: SH3 domain-containing protein [Bacteroidota bacterium]